MGEVWTVKRLMDATGEYLARRKLDSPRLMAELLIGHVLGLDRIRLYTSYDRPVNDDERARLRDLVKRAGEGEPVQYLVGVAHFYSLELIVTPAVLIPRPETETLVESVLRRVKLLGKTHESLRVLDVCCGSGAIGLALAKNLPKASVVSGDVSGEAAEVARRNVDKLGLGDRVEVRVGDLLEVVAGGAAFDLIAANPPYIPSGDIDSLDRNVRDHEPRLALDGGPDGLDLVRRLLAEASPHLVDGGSMYVELQHDQGPRAAELAKGAGWGTAEVVRDLEGRDRVLRVEK